MEEQKKSFEGIAVSARLLSNALSYGPEPEPEAEVEQHLSLQADGTVDFAAYCFGNGEEYPMRCKEHFAVEDESVKELLCLISSCFAEAQQEDFVADAPEWSLILKNEQGKEFRFSGPMLPGNQKLDRISRCLRQTLKRSALFAFDGRSFEDCIERIAVDYRRQTAGEKRQEHLVLDRAAESFEIRWIQGKKNGCASLQWEGLASEILDSLDPDSFLHKMPVQSSRQDPDNKREYSIQIWYRTKAPEMVSGLFEEQELPKDYKEFITNICLLCGKYSEWELARI